MSSSSSSSAPSVIVLLGGDGVGPEVVAEAKKVLVAVAEASPRVAKDSLRFEDHLMGGCAIDATGVPLPASTLSACKSAAAILLGAVGGPQWPRKIANADGTTTLTPRPEQGLLELRKALDLFANLRPCIFPSRSLLDLSPLKREKVDGAAFTIVRELTGGIYFGERVEADHPDALRADPSNPTAWDKMSYSVEEVRRIARVAGEMAVLTTPPATVTSIDKANVLATSRLWRRVVTETLAAEFQGVTVQHQLVDSAAMLMIKDPRALNGVVVTENMFGDILSDEASVIPGSLGLLPSASLNGWPRPRGAAAAASASSKPTVGLYEPIHGSAPDIAGQGIANPIGTILSAALLLRYSLGLEQDARAVEDAVRKVLDDAKDGGRGLRTRDLGGLATTREVGDAVVEELRKILVGA
ncbi:3-isopropylmalate dehydrogenase [Zopfochytrium polystomum]|nr:3-isopropylmalate dehydrogenase [Zopfochytrium polystomum]